MVNEILNTIIKQVEILEKNGFDFEKLAKRNKKDENYEK